MKFSHSIIAALAILVCCKPSGESQSASDTTMYADDTLAYGSDMDNVINEDMPPIKIGYYWGDAWGPNKSFQPFDKVYQEVQVAQKLRDSLYYTHQDGGSTTFTHEDSALFMPAIERAHSFILSYEEQMNSGIKIPKGKRPVRGASLEPEDESHHSLRESSSNTLTKADFMFVGGAPFFEQDAEVYKDLDDKPETHYALDVPENAQFFLNYIYSRYSAPARLSYGPPLSTYEGTEMEIKGKGSIIHVFERREHPIPVWFLTNDGAVPATLLSVEMKLGEQLGCVSNNPRYTFACSRDIAPDAIFGVFVSDNNMPMTRATSSIFGRIWEYDIDGDGAADLASIQGTFAGASSDELVNAIWYVKIGDDWEILDYGSQPDCT